MHLYNIEYRFKESRNGFKKSVFFFNKNGKSFILQGINLYIYLLPEVEELYDKYKVLYL